MPMILLKLMGVATTTTSQSVLLTEVSLFQKLLASAKFGSFVIIR
jgi:hypothetical protein